MQVTVEVKVNMSLMSVRMGGIHCLYLQMFLDAEIIPSIPMVRANEEMVHPAIHCTFNGSHDVYSVVLTQN